MLESLQSMAVVGIAKAVPFPVDFKERTEDRIFKQVSFPGEKGTFRIRAVNTGLRTMSTVVQKTVNTGIRLENPDGKLFRVKAVLNRPFDEVTGVTESHWLTLHHNDFSSAPQSHYQYRVRGVSINGIKSDWVYSEARDETNHLKIYAMLYDILDLITMIQDDELQAYLSVIVQDAFAHAVFKESAPLAQVHERPFENFEHYIREKLELYTGQYPIDEKFVSGITSALQYVADALYQEFKESLLASPEEFTDFARVYKLYDKIQSNPDSIVTLIMQHFLEDTLDKVIQASNIEVLLDNGENQQVYLEGRYNLDIKNEILNRAMTVMPHDNFVFKANDTVQLLSQPIFHDFIDYSVVDETQQTLSMFKQELNELLEAEAAEELMMFIRMVVQEAFLPYAIAEQRLAQVAIDLKDTTEDYIIRDPIVQYDLTSDDFNQKILVAYDLVKDLISGDLPLRQSFEVRLLDQWINQMLTKKHLLLDYNFTEFLLVCAEIGERLSAQYSKLPYVQKESVVTELAEMQCTTLLDDIFETLESVDLQLEEESQLISDEWFHLLEEMKMILSENQILDSTLILKLNTQMEQIQVLVDDQSSSAMVAPIKKLSQQFEQLTTRWGENIATSSVNPNKPVSDELSLMAGMEKAFVYPTTSQQTKDQMLIRLADKLLEKVNKIPYAYGESKQVSIQSSINPTYIPHPHDVYGRYQLEKQDIFLTPMLNDKFVMSGNEEVNYALGDVSNTGWPIGKFILGTNTLKGVT
jgi:hypothetical protein